MNCKACKNPGCAARGTDHHIDGATCYGYIPLTNADRIRAMTDEELARYPCKAKRDGVMLIFPTAHYSDEDVRELDRDWLGWLKQEAKE